MTSYTPPSSNMMKRDISASLNQKCLILCSKTVLIVLQSTSLTALLPWQHTGFQTFPILKGFLAILIFADINSHAWSSKHINIQSFNVLRWNWPRLLYLYTQYNIRLSVWRHQSSHLHILYIFEWMNECVFIDRKSVV